jgi:hypothetical protein
LADDINSEYYLKTLVVNTQTLNLRSGPGGYSGDADPPFRPY